MTYKMTRQSPLDELMDRINAPWYYLGYGLLDWKYDYADFEEIREQLFAEYMGWTE